MNRFVACCIADTVVTTAVDVDDISVTIYRSVFVHLLPMSTTLPLYCSLIPIPNLMNDTSDPALHSLTSNIEEYVAKSGMM